LSGRKSCSMVRSQVRRGRPGGRFQSRGSPEMMDRRTRVWYGNDRICNYKIARTSEYVICLIQVVQ